MAWETCTTCGAWDKRGAHDDCVGRPSEWRPCATCGAWDDMTAHAH